MAAKDWERAYQDSATQHAPVFEHLRPRLAPHSEATPTCEDFLGGLGVILRGTLTCEECRAFIELSEGKGYQNAEDYCMMYRDRWNDRFMSDDAELASFLWERVKVFVPQRLEMLDRNWEVDFMNTRFRFCKYVGGKGHYFGAHTDGMYRVDNDHTSLLTCMFYLNSGDEFKGGLTNFIEYRTKTLKHSIKPEPGLCLIFRQVDLRTYHEGTMVTEGFKYILRADIMFRAVED